MGTSVQPSYDRSHQRGRLDSWAVHTGRVASGNMHNNWYRFSPTLNAMAVVLVFGRSSNSRCKPPHCCALDRCYAFYCLLCRLLRILGAVGIALKPPSSRLETTWFY